MIDQDERAQDAERANKSYMQRNEDERKARLERNNIFAAKVKEVGGFLGKEWSFADKRGAEWLDAPCPTFTLTKRDGETLYFYFGNDRRLNISGQSPDGANMAAWAGYRIGVSPGKKASAIAMDIQRRLLPDYLPAFQTAAETKRDYLAIMALAAKKATEVAEVFGTTPRTSGGGEFTIYTNKPGFGSPTIKIQATPGGWGVRIEGTISASTLDALVEHAGTVK